MTTRTPEKLRRFHEFAAKVALDRLEAAIKASREDLEAGLVPSASLTEFVTRYDRAITALSVIEILEQEEEGS